MKIDITGTQGEVSFMAPDGKVVSADSAMDEIAVGITLSGDHPIVLVFEDLKDIALFRLDLGVVQAEELARALLQMADPVNVFWVIVGIFVWPEMTLCVILWKLGHPYLGVFALLFASTTSVKEVVRTKIVRR